MNAPNRFQLYVLGDNEKLLEVQEDTKIPNAATFRINKQDHTMAGMIRSQLLKSNSVLFAGYKVPHPLEPHFVLKVQTDGSLTPQKALEDACQDLIALVADLKIKFDKEFDMKSLDSVLGAGTGMGGAAGAYGYGAGAGGAYGTAGTGAGGDGAGGWDSRNRGVGADYLDFGS